MAEDGQHAFDPNTPLGRVWWAGSVGLKKKHNKQVQVVDVIRACNDILRRVNQSGEPAEEDARLGELLLLIGTSPRVAGVMLVGLCQILKGHFEEFEAKLRHFILQLIRGQQQIAVSSMTMSETHLAALCEENAESLRPLRKSKKKRGDQEGDEGNEEWTELSQQLLTPAQLKAKMLKPQKDIRKEPDMSWLMAPETAQSLTEIQEYLDTIGSSISSSPLTSGQTSALSGKGHETGPMQLYPHTGDGTTTFNILLENDNEAPVEIEEEQEELFFGSTGNEKYNEKGVPVLALGNGAVEKLKTPIRMGEPVEIIHTERSAVRGGDTVRRRDSVDPLNMTEDLMDKRRKKTDLRPSVFTRSIRSGTTMIDENINRVTKISQHRLSTGFPVYSFNARGLTMVPPLWATTIKKFCRPTEIQFAEVIRNELRCEILRGNKNMSDMSLFDDQSLSDMSSEALAGWGVAGRTSEDSFKLNMTSDIFRDCDSGLKSNVSSVRTPGFPELSEGDLASNLPDSVSEAFCSDDLNIPEARIPNNMSWTLPDINSYASAARKLLRTILLSMKAGGEKPQGILFDKLVAPSCCTKWQAAITFRHLLSLANGGDLCLSQKKPYSAIEIQPGLTTRAVSTLLGSERPLKLKNTLDEAGALADNENKRPRNEAAETSAKKRRITDDKRSSAILV